jgi:DNA-binding transcriptional MocR family regulator
MTRLFEKISRHIARQIETGAFKVNGRVPSVRVVAQQFSVSTNTVLHAFATLEAQGLIEARPQSGYFVSQRAGQQLDVPQMALRTKRPAVPQALGDRLPGFFRSMRNASVVNFGAACPAPELLPGARLNAVLARVARLQGPATLRYDPLPGYAPLRREVARRMAAFGCAVSSDDILTTVGAIEALHLSLRATTKPGDAVLVESPCYFGVLQLLSALGLRAIEVPADSVTGMPLEKCAAALRKERPAACLVIPNFSNPLGSLMPVQAKQDLVALCESARVPLIESDVYGDLAFNGARPIPLKAFDSTGNVLHCSSFSKTLAPSLRVGYLAPGRYLERTLELKFTHTVATPSITQAVVAEFLVGGGFEKHLRQLRRALHIQVGAMREAVASSFPKGTRASNPQGGFLIWVQLPDARVSAVELQRRALAAGISIAPGTLFSARGGFDHCLRLSCGQPWTERQESAITQLGHLANTL